MKTRVSLRCWSVNHRFVSTNVTLDNKERNPGCINTPMSILNAKLITQNLKNPTQIQILPISCPSPSRGLSSRWPAGKESGLLAQACSSGLFLSRPPSLACLPPPSPSTPVCRAPSSLPGLLDSGPDHLLRMTQILALLLSSGSPTGLIHLTGGYFQPLSPRGSVFFPPPFDLVAGNKVCLP